MNKNQTSQPPKSQERDGREAWNSYVPQADGGLGSWVLRLENAGKEKLLFFFLGLVSGRLEGT